MGRVVDARGLAIICYVVHPASRSNLKSELSISQVLSSLGPLTASALS